MTDTSEAKEALRTLVLCLVPYRDPLTRRRVRRAARVLVAPGPWTAEKASSNEVAQLALLRLLWLQREAHNVARRGMFESVALLTRAAIDTCIVGLYCLTVSDAAERLNKVNASNLEAMMKYLPVSFSDPETRATLIRLIDTPTKNPNTFDMALAVDKAAGDDQTEKLYRAYYAPLSSLYAHGGGLALLRHTKKDKIRDEPAKFGPCPQRYTSWTHASAFSPHASPRPGTQKRLCSTLTTKRTAGAPSPPCSLWRGLPRAPGPIGELCRRVRSPSYGLGATSRRTGQLLRMTRPGAKPSVSSWSSVSRSSRRAAISSSFDLALMGHSSSCSATRHRGS